MQLIKNQSIVEDNWQIVAPGTTPSDLPNGDLILPLPLWQQCHDQAAFQNRQLGVSLTSSESIDAIIDHLNKLQVISLEFPIFKDGRHYSSARLLRDRYGYKGEIRAFGDVNRDQLAYMTRVGFNAFQLKADADLTSALQAFNEFSVSYQSSHDQPLPLYRRR